MKKVKRGKISHKRKKISTKSVSPTYNRYGFPGPVGKITPGESKGKEKVILLLFLAFVVLALVILFKPQINETSTNIIGFATSNIQLENANPNATARLTGHISLGLDQNDVLPPNSVMTFFILSNAPKISSEYVCPNGQLVPWENETGIIDYDPEGTCCLRAGSSCSQIVLNSGFEAPLSGIRWTKAPKNISADSIYTYDEIFGLNGEYGYDEEGNAITYTTKILTLDTTSGFTTSASAGVRQQITGARSIKIANLGDFCYDTDGNNGHTQGVCQDKVNANKLDSCSGNILTEYSCVSNKCQATTIDCSSLGGTCISGKCTSNIIIPPEQEGGFTGYSIFTLIPSASAANTAFFTSDRNIGVGPFQVILKINFTNAVPIPPAKATFDCGNGQRADVPITGVITTYTCNYLLVSDTITYHPTVTVSGSTSSLAITNYPRLSSTSLSYDIDYEQTDSPCAVDVVVSSTSGKNLHYYYDLSGGTDCPYSALHLSSNNNSMILSSLIADTWQSENFDLYSAWASKFPSAVNDNISGIDLVAYGRMIGEAPASQIVHFDNVRIRRGTQLEPTTCAEANNSNYIKKCCIIGTGYGNYYGEQLSCDEDHECWSSCTSVSSKNLTGFIAASTEKTNNNKTQDECKAITEAGEINLGEYCDTGYTACITNSTPKCRNSDGSLWDSTYNVNLSSFNLKAPAENGSYSLVWQYTYSPSGGYCGNGDPAPCLIFSKSAQFTVGNYIPPTTNWVCGNYSSCSNGIQTANCTEINSGATRIDNRTCCWSCTAWLPETCASELDTQTRTCTESLTTECAYISATKPNETQSCIPGAALCISSDWQCGAWSKCAEGQQYRTCDKLSDCDEYADGSYKPDESQTCGSTGKSRFLQQYLIYIIIVAIVAVVVIFLFLKVLKKPKYAATNLSSTIQSQNTNAFAKTSQSKAAYPEVVSYIKDAKSSGASRQDIEQKLSEAGWPKDVIDDSFNAVGM